MRYSVWDKRHGTVPKAKCSHTGEYIFSSLPRCLWDGRGSSLEKMVCGWGFGKMLICFMRNVILLPLNVSICVSCFCSWLLCGRAWCKAAFACILQAHHSVVKRGWAQQPIGGHNIHCQKRGATLWPSQLLPTSFEYYWLVHTLRTHGKEIAREIKERKKRERERERERVLFLCKDSWGKRCRATNHVSSWQRLMERSSPRCWPKDKRFRFNPVRKFSEDWAQVILQ